MLLGVGAFAFLPIALVILILLGRQNQNCSPTSGAPSQTSAALTIIGDSLTVGATADLKGLLPNATVTAKGAMPWSWGLDKLPSSGMVAYLLDTNGGVSSADVTRLLSAHPHVTFVLMTTSVPFSYMGPTNTAIRGAAQPGRVVVADWQQKVAADPSLLGADRVHPSTAAGWKAFADTVATAVRGATPQVPSTTMVSSSQSVGPPYTQAQMEAAVAKYDPQQAHVLGAIAMAESGGHAFPTTNSTGVYHGPWAFQEQSNPALDFHRLDTDLDYAAKAAADLAKSGITYGKWETYGPTGNGAYMKFMNGQSAGSAAAPQGGATLVAAQSSTSCAPTFSTGPGGVASGAGWTFPLRTTQAALRRGGETTSGQFESWCYTDLNNCHHDYNAADLMAPTGTPVLAPMDGTVVSTHPGLGAQCVYDNRGDNFSFRADNGMAFFMGHMLTGSMTVHVGQHVAAGTQVGVVGRAAEAQCTVSHLHIQENPAGQYGNQQDPLNVQPVLVGLFSKLPV